MNKLLVVATGNPGKLKEMQAYLQDLDIKLQLKPEDLEVEETGKTFLENACLKASQVAKATGEWAIADDSGLAVDALNGAPGIYSARYAPTEAERISRLLTELGETSNRQAQFVCAVAVARHGGHLPCIRLVTDARPAAAPSPPPVAMNSKDPHESHKRALLTPDSKSGAFTN